MDIIKTDSKDFEAQLARMDGRGKGTDERVASTVKEIIDRVALYGDQALFEYTEKFDGYTINTSTIKVSDDEIREAASKVAKGDFDNLKLAARRIEQFHEKQLQQSWSFEDEPGIELGQLIRPLERVGIYAPGGTAAYPSTLLMAAIPARIAGVANIILTTPTKGGILNPLMATAVTICGIRNVFRIGGAQAIAALACGTASVPRVDKIVGPGRDYVAMAKQMVYGRTAIDMIAGPSEVVIISDGKTDPAFVAADMLAQAEHDALAASILLTPDETFARKVASEIESQLAKLSRAGFAGASIKDFGAVIVTRDLTEAVEIANRIGPEHLELMVENPREMLDGIKNAGAVMLGYDTPAVLGDYIAGPNHILPTAGTARFSSPLGVYDFVKRTSVISFSRAALEKYGAPTVRLAELEGLDGHGKSIGVRLSRK